MADTKISALAAASSLGDTDELVLASAGTSKKITGANLKASSPPISPQPGILAPDCPGSLGSMQLIANRCCIVRFVADKDRTINFIAFAVTQLSGTDDTCEVGLYTSTLNKIVGSGTLSGRLTSTGVKPVAVAPTPITRGTVYHAVFLVGPSGGGANLRSISGGTTSAFDGEFFGSAAPNKEYGVKDLVFFPLPATLSYSASPLNPNVPLLAIRES